MPLTFGAVGDVINLALLVKDVLNALDSSYGASSEYQALKCELYILERVLLEVEHLFREYDKTSELHKTCKTAALSVADCHAITDSFLKQMEKYDKALGGASSKSALNRTAAKMKWRLLDKDIVFRFHNDITRHTAFLNTLLSSASQKLMHLHHHQLSGSLSLHSHATLDLLSNQSIALIDIRDRLDGEYAIMGRQEDSLARIQHRLRRLNSQHSLLGYALALLSLLGEVLRHGLPHLRTGLELIQASRQMTCEVETLRVRVSLSNDLYLNLTYPSLVYQIMCVLFLDVVRSFTASRVRKRNITGLQVGVVVLSSVVRAYELRGALSALSRCSYY